MIREDDPFLLAFMKLFAPRPIIYIFPDLAGWWYVADEIPETYQVIVGVSEELYCEIEHMILTTSTALWNRGSC